LASRSAKKPADRALAEQVVKARMFTENFGGINDFQVMHLKYWSRVALAHCHDVEVAVALPSLETVKSDDGSRAGTVDTLNDESRVEFRGLTNARPPRNSDKVYRALYRSIGDLLGKHFDFAVVINGQKMFSRSGRKRDGGNVKAIIERLKQEAANVS
jgi:hypothetical protein